jgi:hypothetical protein
MYHKVLPIRSLRRSMVRVKLAPKFIDPFKIMKEREEEFKVEFSKFLFQSARNSGTRFILRG